MGDVADSTAHCERPDVGKPALEFDQGLKPLFVRHEDIEKHEIDRLISVLGDALAQTA